MLFSCATALLAVERSLDSVRQRTHCTNSPWDLHIATCRFSTVTMLHLLKNFGAAQKSNSDNWLKNQFSSVRDGIYVLGKAHMHSAQPLWIFHNVAFETVPMFVWLTMALCCPFNEDCRALLFPTHFWDSSGDRWCGVLGFVPAGSASSSSTIQIFRDASHLRWLLCAPVSLLGYFLYSGMSRAAHPQELSKVDVDHWHSPV